MTKDEEIEALKKQLARASRRLENRRKYNREWMRRWRARKAK